MIIGEGHLPLVVPGCCQSSLYHPTITLRFARRADREMDEPVWTAALPASFTEAIDFHEYVKRGLDRRLCAAACCPFCGAPVPRIRRREGLPPRLPFYRPDRDGDYCGTCSERSHACECYDEVLMWETVEPEPMLRERFVLVHPDRGVFLGLSKPDGEQIWSAVNSDRWLVWAAPTTETASLWETQSPDIGFAECEAVPVMTGNVFERAHAFECILAGCPPWHPRTPEDY